MSVIEKVKSMAARRLAKTLTVKSAKNLTPNMRRVTLHGDAVSSFSGDVEGYYVKLLFNQAGQDKPATRTYTISEHRAAQNEIDIDFMLHSASAQTPHGIAAPWSMHTQAGDEISVAGPGNAQFINTDAEYFLLAADMTALPALKANLKRLSKSATGQVFIEVLSEADQQNLHVPEGVKVHWVVNNDPGTGASPLYHAIADAKLPEQQIAAWVACEFKSMKKIRQYLKTDLQIEKSHLYISSYWKRGDTEDEHKVAKKADSRSH